ncbi:MAG: right-handed parallel beta-helix repeat-containing protein, partial [Verrucomicrobiales bacterium]
MLIRKVHDGIRLVRRNRNVIVSHCHVYHNTGAGIFLDGVNLHQINISGSHISYNRLGGIRIERSEVRNLQITGNDIEYNNAKTHPGLADEPTAEIYVDTTAPGASV